MIRKIDHLKGAGFFRDFHWASAGPGQDFQRLTLIYGPNGGGKSSIATALLRRKNDDQSQWPDIRLIGEDGAEFIDYSRVFVFSESYVNANYHLSATDATTPSIIAVGEKNAADQQELLELQAKVPALEKTVSRMRASQTRAEERLRTTLVAVRNQVNAALSTVSTDYQSNHFRTDVVERRYGGSRSTWVPMTADELRDALAQVKAQPLGTLTHVPLVTLTDASLRTEAEDLLRAQPISVALDTLVDAHPKAAQWVHDGIPLHDEADHCLFCGGPLTAARREQLAGHFSDEVKHTEDRTHALIQRTTALRDAFNQAQASMPQLPQFDSSLRKVCAQVLDTQTLACAQMVGWCDSVIERLNKKAADVVGHLDMSPVPMEPTVDDAELVELINQHNLLAKDTARRRKQLAEQIVIHYLNDNQGAYDKARKEVTNAETVTASSEKELVAAQERLADLTQPKGSVTPSAEFLTDEVARLLGRRELTFKAKDFRTYEIQRDGHPALGLSEGEKTAITLVHFLEQIRRWDKPTGLNPIVVVDDPVSSLDHGVYMGVSSALWALFVKDDAIEQMVLLTHDFDLFRQWDTQFDYLPGSLRGSHDSNRCTLELVSRYTEPDHHREPRLVAWPPSENVRKKVRSTYHHAFLRLVEAQAELLDANVTFATRLEAQLLFPNVIRRVLESFLAFKFPGDTSTLSQLMAACAADLEAAIEPARQSGFSGDPDSLRHDLMRYSNTYSHDINPETTSLITPEEVLPAITSLFIFMDALDHAHFKGMCDVAGRTPTLIIPSPAANGGAV